MAKVYIAGKITGLENYKELFKRAEVDLRIKGHVCMHSSVLGKGFEWDEYMKICFTMITVCDVVYMLKNWRDSQGARIEHAYAIKHNKKIIYQVDSE